MKTKRVFRKTKRLRPSKRRLSKTALDRLVEEAIVDAYNESEQAMGFYTMIEENLKVPFVTDVLSIRPVTPRLSQRRNQGSQTALAGFRKFDGGRARLPGPPQHFLPGDPAEERLEG